MLPRLDGVGLVGAGSFSPKNEGPLIDVFASGATEAGALRTGSAELRAGGRSVPSAGVDPTLTACGLLARGAGASRVVPHIPQKRLSSGFSFPQRGQRTGSPLRLYSLRYLSHSMH